MKRNHLISAVALALSVGMSQQVWAGNDCRDGNNFTISGGKDETIGVDPGGNPVPAGLSGYADALLSASCAGKFTFEYLGSGDARYENKFYVKDKLVFDTKTSQVGETYTVYLTAEEFAAHTPFHFQSNAAGNGPSVFNGEGPMGGSYSGTDYENQSIFYAIDDDGKISPTNGEAVYLGLADGSTVITPLDNDHQDLGVRITYTYAKKPRPCDPCEHHCNKKCNWGGWHDDNGDDCSAGNKDKCGNNDWMDWGKKKKHKHSKR